MTVTITTSNVRWYDGLADGDGCGLGSAITSKVGFWGKAPAVRPVLTPVSASAATTTLNETRITRLQTLVVNLGLCATA